MMSHVGYMYYNPFAGIISTVLWILAIILIFRIIRGPRWRTMHGRGLWEHKDALDILKERYAKGEINKQEFEERKADLIKKD